MKVRGRHQSMCAAGKRTLQLILQIPGVTGVSLGHAVGQKRVGSNKPVGWIKLQRASDSSIKGILMSSYAAHEVRIYAKNTDFASVRSAIERSFPP